MKDGSHEKVVNFLRCRARTFLRGRLCFRPLWEARRVRPENRLPPNADQVLFHEPLS